jgi:hypothetical protein
MLLIGAAVSFFAGGPESGVREAAQPQNPNPAYSAAKIIGRKHLRFCFCIGLPPLRKYLNNSIHKPSRFSGMRIEKVLTLRREFATMDQIGPIPVAYEGSYP